MAELLMVKPSSGDSRATLFTTNGSGELKPLESINSGTILKKVGSSGNYYNVEYDNGKENVALGGTGYTGTIFAYPYTVMYEDSKKTIVVANINNGTACQIEDDSISSSLLISAHTTEGWKTGYVDAKYIIRDANPLLRAAIEPLDFGGSVSSKSSLVVRDGPSSSSNKVGTLLSNKSVKIIESNSGWYKLAGLPELSPTPAWANAAFIKIDGSTSVATIAKTDAVKVSSSSSASTAKTSTAKSIDELAREVINGKWGNGSTRKSKLTAAGYDYAAVQARVNEILKGSTSSSVDKTVVQQPTSTGTTQEANDDWSKYSSGKLVSSDYTANDEYYKQLAEKYAYALGSPPRYNNNIDIQYTDEIIGGGRVVNKTILSNPALLSICPGKVKMFPHQIGTKKDGIVEAMLGAASGNTSLYDKIIADSQGKFSGKLYSFEADTAEYSKYVNAMCRACAIMLGIGDEVIPDTTTKLKHFDYTYWTIRKKYNPNDAARSDSDTSLFRNFWPELVKTANRLATTAIDDTTYINFFMNGTETSVSENISNSVTDSPLSGVLNTVSSLASQVNYFTGSGFDLNSSDVTSALEAALGSSGSVLGGIASVAENFMKGGRMILPKMVEGSQYGKTISCNLKFVSPYGNKYSVFLKCLVPICHLLAMALPRQLSDNMYTYPFLVRCAQTGHFVVDLGIISSLTITRGGNDETSWTVDTLATEWDVQLEITPLVDELMITSTSNPVLMCKNEMLLDYLSNFCGFDMLAYNLDTKADMIGSFIRNWFTGIPHSIENKFSDFLYNTVNKFFNMKWG